MQPIVRTIKGGGAGPGSSRPISTRTIEHSTEGNMEEIRFWGLWGGIQRDHQGKGSDLALVTIGEGVQDSFEKSGHFWGEGIPEKEEVSW